MPTVARSVCSFLLPVLALAFIAGCAAGGGARADAPSDLRVMTFNVRYGTAKDGPNHWDLRKELCASRITAFGPDLLGLQEALDFQNAFLLGKLPGYAALGVSREDGKAKGEFTTLLYRTERFAHLASGTFWLSETPDVVGSKSWDSSLPRIATWARLRDLRAGRELLVLNTHFDHKGATSRHEAAKLLRTFLGAQAAGLPVLVTGDFNAVPGSDPYRALLDPQPQRIQFVDAYAVVHAAKPEADEGTAHAYKDKPVTGRIDWILCTDAFVPRSAAIDRHREGPLFPSDHYPVHAVLGWR